MLNDYVDRAMQHARYELLEDGTTSAKLMALKGSGRVELHRRNCTREVRETLEEWILLNIADHTPLPVVDGLSLDVGKSV
jgi:hypothetical protein